MATPKYRVIDPKGAYMARSDEPQLLALGADHAAAAVYNIRAPVFALLREGTEVETNQPPGPHLEPLNDEARAAMAAYWDAHPNATLDPTRRMPLGMDPMGGRTTEQLVTALLDGMDRDAVNRAAPAGQGGADNAALMERLAEGQAALMQALTAVLAGQAAGPSGTAGKGAR